MTNDTTKQWATLTNLKNRSMH